MDAATPQARYFPQGTLALAPDVPGAMAWGVALQHTQLTYFEVEPHCRFERHQHASEQITLVLEGELSFELDGATHCLKPGEVIAIPANVPHAVFTGSLRVRAVDAWSPVMARYRMPTDNP